MKRVLESVNAIDQMKSLFDFFCNSVEADLWERLYEELDKYLTNNFQASPLLIFSYPVNMEFTSAVPLEKFRNVWHRSAVGRNYEVDEIAQLLSYVSEVKKGVSAWDTVEIKGARFNLFYIGRDDRQIFFGAYRAPADFIVDKELALLLSRFVGTCYANISRWNNANQMSSLIYMDDVTNLFNQRKLLKDLDFNIKRYNEYGDPFFLLFIDIDYFKNVNDKYGHIVGTQLLLKLGAVLKNVLRDSDLIYRYGGDEFVILVPDSSNVNGRVVGERILNAVKNQDFIIDGINFKLSISIGLASFPQDAASSKEVLEMADRLMYQAKRGGRGRVCLAEELFK